MRTIMARSTFTIALIVLLAMAALAVVFTPQQTGFAVQNAIASPASRPGSGSFKHGIVLEQSTQNVPSTWMHGNKNGLYGTYYVPPTWKHVEKHISISTTVSGPEGTSITLSETAYTPSAYVPPNYVHLGSAFGLDTIYTDPSNTYHVKIGPDATTEVAAGDEHIEEGTNATKYVKYGKKHYTSPPEIATTIDALLTKHASIDGPFKTKIVPDVFKHVDGPDCGESCTTYTYPDYYHVSSGLDKTSMLPDDWPHVTTGPKASYHVPQTEHVAEGAKATEYALIHITIGVEESRYVLYADQHVAEGPDATAYKKGSLPPIPSPTPPIQD